ncbi:molybdate-binding periplasmic protein ModA [Methyloglobulus morosus KoM1]|uniref:Molybdate-binding periplasmic protein ModA n=1 Tax=Methyloglobulus morosus KoM1 TaxID=1116472 RepID=V5C3G3_9GAMM|nr:molybdate ABC transporter substrate-binding protein [Methyloglobulus morosus]ESS73012.1 molybdate-binding periplasmic protein ModA [Methyloglobulus morosus KoM1]
MLRSRFFHILCVIGLISIPPVVWAGTTLVAVASNFTKPMNDIAAAFNKATGHEASLSFGSSGKFVAQIENDAPFEVFLSADEKNPKKLEESGKGVANSRFTYAIGKLVLWSAKPGLVDEQGQILSKGGFKHLALADPKLAPYGLAAEEALKNLGLLDKLRPLFVLGENISQTQQFISSGNAELGFIALSQVIGKDGKITEGSGWIVPDTLYNPIRQDAILLKKGEPNPAASALLGFMKSPEALEIIQAYGYSIAK